MEGVVLSQVWLNSDETDAQSFFVMSYLGLIFFPTMEGFFVVVLLFVGLVWCGLVF